MCKSRVSKRNIVSNEICGALLGAKTLHNLVQPLIYDYEDQDLSMFMLHDSTCFLAMLNKKINTRNVLISNCIYGYKDVLSQISTQFRKSTIHICHIGGGDNPSDFMTKLLADPVQVINSNLYRYGPSRFSSVDLLMTDIIAEVSNGSFELHGLPTKGSQHKHVHVLD